MITLTSSSGETDQATVRRTESQDVYSIIKLKTRFTEKTFGNVNVIYLLWLFSHLGKNCVQ
ncbi:hypothetical protein GDO86_009262 [Hymenochirus boettgeri]|uniref:Uncharacterized protein n=1 Tax=Hymenochirus boettgeri TaxID=247094 RepID=A0A8T2JND5_9PIPI|nr:hypothetical protein GDO86_009262 [Hymenochirus boettgeri]